jgi:quercetin dioxygenase-like cupin family protein
MPAEVTVIAAGPATGGAYALLDVRAAAGTVLAPHVAHRHDDVLLVLSGELEVETGAGVSVLRAGEHVALARRAPRRLCALDDLRVVVLSVPAGLEQLADLLAGPAPEADDLAALLTVAGISLLSRV